MGTAFRMDVIYRNIIFNSIIHRYSSILTNYDINDTANKIIQKIMANEIQSLFALAQELDRLKIRFRSLLFRLRILTLERNSICRFLPTNIRTN